MKIQKIEKCKIYHFKSGILPPFQLDIYFYIVDGLMIDAGSNNIMRKATKLLRNERIDAVAITHIHEDHTGLAWWLQNEKNVTIYIHKNSIEEASHDSNIPFYRKLVWGNRKGFRAFPIPAQLQTEYYSFDVIEAPGHHNDHIVLYEKSNGWLFTGDLFVSTKQRVAFVDENINTTIQTLQQLLVLDFEIIFCSHSGQQQKGKEKLKRKLDYFLSIQQQVQILKQKGLTTQEIDKILFPQPNLWTVVSCGEWSTLNIIKTIE
ncbi:MAG: MBL fold metallo-hydrolase [Spirochaetes bacterium]|nr:MBL fold metallo-hydrolase [Spirochaetota bacterium]